MPYTDSSDDALPSSRTSISASAPKDRLRVIIVGGSVAGLTLALCLHHSNIDFVVLEARNEIAPQVGASIVVLPNGARILDQLGVFDDIFAMVEPLQNGLTWTGDGKLVVNSNAPLLTGIRMGYPLAFLQRQDLLKVLSDHTPDKTKVHTSKKVSKVDHTDSGVIVHCADGSEYAGDIVVGADGIHSTVKKIMDQHIELSHPGATETDSKSVSAEYNCIFGLGNPVEGEVNAGDSHRSYAQGHSTLSFIGRGGMIYWFLFSKLDKRYYGKDIPRYTTADAEEAVKAFFDIHMTDNITFDKVWEQRTFANMSCVEESQNEHWTADRFVCLGDSIHKMTPNLGAGGNAAIESAAALANSLSRLTGTSPSLEEVQKALNEFFVKRHGRANTICNSANELTRIEALATLPDKIMALYAIPALGDFLSDITCDSMVGAELLEALPPPPRSLTATMPWNPDSGVGKHEKKWVRAFFALPLLLVFFGCCQTMGPSMGRAIPSLVNAVKAGALDLGNGQVVSLCTSFFGIKSVDKLISLYVAAFTPCIGGFDAASRMQMIAFLGDLVPMQAIWMIEGVRRGNFTTAAHLLPTILGVLYQLKGIGYVAPLYFFLHYIQSPLENYHAADNRLTQIGAVKTIIPTITLSYILPSIAMAVAPGLANRQWINGLFWQPFPIYASIFQRVLGRFVKDTTDVDRIYNPEADMPYLRRTYIFAGAVAACAGLYVRFASPVSLMNVFFEGIRNPSVSVSAMASLSQAFRYDQIAAFSAGALWTMLSFKDLKKAGKLSAGWGEIVGVFAGTTIVAGSGAAMAAMWAWREEALAKREKVVLGEK